MLARGQHSSFLIPSNRDKKGFITLPLVVLMFKTLDLQHWQGERIS